MSIITGMSNKPSWSNGEETKLQKTASVGGESLLADNPLYIAAKKFIQAQAEEICDVCGKNPCECDMNEADPEVKDVAKTEEDETVEIDIVEDNAPVASSVSEAVKEIEDKAQKAEEIVEKVESSIEAIEDAAKNLRDISNTTKPEGGDKEVKDVGDEKGGTDIVVESEPEKEVEACVASSRDQYVKLSEVSPENKKKIKKYWVDDLGYPKDYIDIWLKD